VAAQAFVKRRMLGSAHGIVQFVRNTAVPQVLELREERRDPDSAGDHEMFARDLVEREQIDRVRDLEAAADANLLVHEVGASARLFHAPYRDLIMVPLVGWAQQGIGVAMHAAVGMHDDDDV
jgi:hypothetical protein